MVSRQAGPTSEATIEVTPEMIEAGVAVLMADVFYEGSENLAELTVRELFAKALSRRHEET